MASASLRHRFDWRGIAMVVVGLAAIGAVMWVFPVSGGDRPLPKSSEDHRFPAGITDTDQKEAGRLTDDRFAFVMLAEA